MTAVLAQPDAPRRLQSWAALLFVVLLARQLAVTIALDPHAVAWGRSSWPFLICHTP